MIRLDETTTRLLLHLHRGSRWLHLWTPQQRRSLWLPARAGVDLFVPASWQEDVYYQVFAGAPEQRSSRTRIKATEITAVSAFAADFDGKDRVSEAEYGPHLPRDFAGLSAVKQRIAVHEAKEAAFYAAPALFVARALRHVERMAQAYFPPSLTVASGGGYQCLWLLDAPWPVDDGNRAEAAETLAGFAGMMGADVGAALLTQLLRLPGTHNCKPGWGAQRPRVAVVQADFGLLYTWQQIEEAVQDWLAAHRPADAARLERHHRPYTPRPGDDVRAIFNRVINPAEILVRHGYKLLRSWPAPPGGSAKEEKPLRVAELSRPGKPLGHEARSISVFYGKWGFFSYHWSTNDELYSEGRQRDAFNVFAMLEHNGDFRAAYAAAKRELYRREDVVLAWAGVERDSSRSTEAAQAPT